MAEKYSDAWTMGDDGVIRHDQGKFYTVVQGPYGNPLIYQAQGGDVYLTIVVVDGETMILCEKENVSEDGVSFTKQLRAVRASLDNPDQPDLGGETVALGESHSNTQRVLGPPDRHWLVTLAQNPDPSKYELLSLTEFAATKDGIGQAALGKAFAMGLIS
jgi:hypothetical protein